MSLGKLANDYKLDIPSLASGIVSGRFYDRYGNEKVFTSSANSVLNVFDCFRIGRESHSHNDYNNANQWFEEALKRSDKESIGLRTDILEYLAYNAYKRGDYKRAIDWMSQSLRISPERYSNHMSVKYFKLLSQLKDTNDTKVEQMKPKSTSTEEDMNDMNVRNVMKKLCRGERLLSDKIASELNCFHLNTTEIPFLRLTRIKVEELYKRPQIVLIHKFLSEVEIGRIIALAKPELERMTVYSAETGVRAIIPEARIAEKGRLTDQDDIVVETMSRCTGIITGLDITYARALGVNRYIVGGFYDLHFDGPSCPKMQKKDKEICKYKFASQLSYLNDVDSGGATVFPLLNLTVWPEKGSSLLWFNGFSSGERNNDTLHAGCPVLVGTKWSSLKYFHTFGSELRKPCRLKKTKFQTLF